MWRATNDPSSVDSDPFQYRKRYEITCDFKLSNWHRFLVLGFNTASGMRSHVTKKPKNILADSSPFQYRKRYEITCDHGMVSQQTCRCVVSIPQAVWDHMWLSSPFNRIELTLFQYRKRYEITCDINVRMESSSHSSFNTASGMRSHVTGYYSISKCQNPEGFQYRKRYEITCDQQSAGLKILDRKFQYRKRYEITCDKSRRLTKGRM